MSHPPPSLNLLQSNGSVSPPRASMLPTPPATSKKRKHYELSADKIDTSRKRTSRPSWVPSNLNGDTGSPSIEACQGSSVEPDDDAVTEDSQITPDIEAYRAGEGVWFQDDDVFGPEQGKGPVEQARRMAMIEEPKARVDLVTADTEVEMEDCTDVVPAAVSLPFRSVQDQTPPPELREGHVSAEFEEHGRWNFLRNNRQVIQASADKKRQRKGVVTAPQVGGTETK